MTSHGIEYLIDWLFGSAQSTSCEN